jgi:methionyl-tRNA formyltransferase
VQLAFLGTPEAAVPPLRALVDDGHDVRIVVTQPDRKRGRGGALVPSPVKAAATELGIPVAHDVDAVLGVGAALGVVVAFGKLIKPHVLAQLPMVNIHFSLLPRWRGAAPLERAILAGDTETGVCLMALEEGLDTGPVYDLVRMPIGDDETADELRDRLVAAGTDLLVKNLRTGLGVPVPLEGEPTYASKLDVEDHHLDWSRPAVELHRIVRLGRAWTTLDGKRFLVLRATQADEGPAPGHVDGVVVGTGDGRGLRLEEVQPEGRGRQPAKAWRNGLRVEGALVLGS